MRHSALRLCCTTALVSLFSISSWAQQPVKEGREFPSFGGRCVRTGKTIKLEDFRGKVVLIDFWATWCGPCKAEIPHVKEVYEKYHDKGFEIISISLDRDEGTLKSFIEREKMEWNHIFDNGGRISDKYGVTGIPQMYVIGKDGKVISSNARGAALERAVKEGIAQKYEGKVVEEDDVDRLAKKRLEEADKLRDAGRYAEALEIYDELGIKYAERAAGKTANERARTLREDPAIMKKIEQLQREKFDREAEEESLRWAKVAKQMADQGKYDLARDYYQKIIDKYPKSSFAAKARTAIEKLPKQ